MTVLIKCYRRGKYLSFGVNESNHMVFVDSVGIYQPTQEHQSLPLALYYFGSDVESDTSLFRKGLLTDGQ